MGDFRNRIFLLVLISLIPANSADTLNTSQVINDGETLVSSGGVFELGFFSLANSSNRYVGIWYKDMQTRTYVWVANRQVPLTTTSGVLRVSPPGVLSLFNRPNDTVSVWSTNATGTSVRNPAAQLLDSGNLVVKDADDGRFVWQSFVYLGDTFLAGVELGPNYETGVETYMSSWRSEDNPAPGDYSIRTDPTGYPQLLLKRGDVVQQRLGPWNGMRWSGAPDTSSDPTYQVMLFMNSTEVKYTEAYSQSVISRIRLIPSGVGQRSTWSSRTNSWTAYTNFPSDNCDNYALCGAHGSCTIGNSPNCACLDRFVPRDPESWIRTDWTSGCVRRTGLNCSEDVFLRYSGIKLPDSTNSSFNDQIMRLEDCQAECKRNCTCSAYARLNISGSGSGCLFYHGDLFDIRTMAQAGQDLFIRMASSESPPSGGSSKSKTRVILIASLTSVACMIIVCLSIFFVLSRRRKKKELRLGENVAGPFSGHHVAKDADLPFFSISTIVQATDNFAMNNKLGEGGFGPVYKGMLEDGQEIAVKRLSKTSSQGVEELKNEVILIAKLQHRNLVRTLGCCAEGEENMLIYEYMPNSSLDLIIFDQSRSMLLDWQKRFGIINGIAKGLLYLHQDSRLRIIHRDLKASNILLDADMNPKISDFGLARSFGGNETEAQTRRVVGTYGYMSPEYAIDGLFSIKSDVFSFGVLVLEIVSGKRNRGFFLKDHSLNLLGHAWRLYKEDNTTQLVDPCLGDSFNLSQVLRSIHVGLLCVQNSPEDRPSMSSVVFMLGNEVALPEAKQPGFFTERDVSADQSHSASTADNSHNNVTMTWMDGR